MATSLRPARSTELRPLDVSKGATEHKYPSLYLTNCKDEWCVPQDLMSSIAYQRDGEELLGVSRFYTGDALRRN